MFLLSKFLFHTLRVLTAWNNSVDCCYRPPQSPKFPVDYLNFLLTIFFVCFLLQFIWTIFVHLEICVFSVENCRDFFFFNVNKIIFTGTRFYSLSDFLNLIYSCLTKVSLFDPDNFFLNSHGIFCHIYSLIIWILIENTLVLEYLFPNFYNILFIRRF